MKWCLIKFNVDCWFAKFTAYRWLMRKVFGRRYYTSEYKFVTSPYFGNPTLDPSPAKLIIFKREPKPGTVEFENKLLCDLMDKAFAPKKLTK